MKLNIKLLRIFCVGFTVLSTTLGCSDRTNLSPFPSITESTKQQLADPVNCGTAARDIQVLQEEKASVGKRILSGVRSVFPIAAVAGILMGDYSDRVEVASGTYNDDIDKKITQISTTCGM